MTFIKTLLLSSAFALLTSTGFAQSGDLTIDFSAKGLMVNATPIVKSTTMDVLIKSLGEPSKKVDAPNGETSMFYDDLGIVFFTIDNVVKGVGVNLNWDEDEKFPETSLNGDLMIGKSAVDKHSTGEFIQAIEGVTFDCPTPIMCIASDRADDVKCMIAFDEGLITQVVFLLD
jgi:hypothetical protein